MIDGQNQALTASGYGRSADLEQMSVCLTSARRTDVQSSSWDFAIART